ncbi:MAG: hypothetical protein AB1758_31980, partial [Candidatus Eremiobacterota bacterium]
MEGTPSPIRNEAEILGPAGRVAVHYESARTEATVGEVPESLELIDVRGGRGHILDWDGQSLRREEIAL